MFIMIFLKYVIENDASLLWNVKQHPQKYKKESL